jgi:hypothetical protein
MIRTCTNRSTWAVGFSFRVPKNLGKFSCIVITLKPFQMKINKPLSNIMGFIIGLWSGKKLTIRGGFTTSELTTNFYRLLGHHSNNLKVQQQNMVLSVINLTHQPLHRSCWSFIQLHQQKLFIKIESNYPNTIIHTII